MHQIKPSVRKKIVRYTFLVLLGLGLSVMFYSPFLLHIRALGIQDWDQNFAWSEFNRLSLVKFHQFPLWDPYRCGGAPQFANPEIPVISIQTFFVLLLGTVIGTKVSIIFHSAFAFIGFYFLSRHYKLSSFGSILASILFVFSGITGSFLSTGMVVFISFAYSPLILLTYLRGEKNKKYLTVSSLLFTLSFYHGYHISLLLLFFLIFYAIAKSIVCKNKKPIISLCIFLGIFLLFSLPKLFLSLQLLSVSPRTVHELSGFTIPQLFYFLFSRKQNLFGNMDISTIPYGIDENSIYVGIVPFFFFCFFFIKNKTQLSRQKVLIVLLICMALLMLGNTIHPSFYNLLKKLPIFSSFRVAQRFRFDFIIPFALIAGMGLDKLLSIRKMNRKLKLCLFIAIMSVVWIDLLTFNQNNFLSKTLIIKNDAKETKSQFKQFIALPGGIAYYPGLIPKEFEYKKRFALWYGEYISIRNNIGIINCSYTLTGPHAAVPSTDLYYHGEWYTKHDSYTVTLLQWTPQAISVSLKPKHTPAQRDTLILNQNYFPGWFVRKDTVLIPAINTNGLISTVITSEKKIQFIYMPYRAIGERLFH